MSRGRKKIITNIDGKDQIYCKCKELLGERTETDIWPFLKTNVFIETGKVYFQCQCGKNTYIDENKMSFCLHKPGTYRIY